MFVVDLIEKYPADYFVETGTASGNTVFNAYKKYKEIRTVDVDKELKIEHDARQFDDTVKFYYGDSRKLLKEMIEDLDGKIFFWLDAHTAPKIELREKYGNMPIMEELDIIKSHPRKNHHIVIDDLETFSEPVFDNITVDNLKDKIKEINPDYKFKTTQDGNILIAYA